MTPSSRAELGHGPRAGAEPFDQDPRRWRMLILVSAAVLLGMSEWFTASAAGPDLQVRWGLSMTQVGWLTTVVQLGFVAGTAVAALLNLADVFPSRAYFAVSALAAAAANAALLFVPGFAVALAARFATGFFLAGVYPPGMKMIATWFRSARGFAIGTVVGALTVGKATPYLLKAAGGPGVTSVILGASLAGCLASVLVLTAYRDGPYPFGRRPFSWAQVLDVFRDRRTMLATGGYLGHMWELYAMWATVSIYFTDFFATPAGGSTLGGFHAAELVAFGVIASGGAGAVVAGVWADRWGRERTTMWLMALSGSCAVMMGWVLPLSGWIVVPLALAWGFTIVADSAQFSACVTEVAPRHAIGTALTLQTSLGFALSAVSIQCTVWLAEVGGWRLAYGVLAVGPVLGILAMGRLRADRHSGRET